MAVLPDNLILTGGIYHPFAEASEALRDVLADVDVSSEITQDMERGLHKLASGQYRMLTLYTLRFTMTQHPKYEPFKAQWAMSLSDQGRKILTDFVQGGGQLLGLHTASICFDTWPDFQKLLGGMWQWGKSHHPPQGLVHVKVMADHPLTKGVDDFSLEDEIYHHLSREPDATPLLLAKHNDEEGAQPLMWARQVEHGRSVYNALGHDAAAIQHPSLARLLKRSALWLRGASDTEIGAV